ncbi:MAG: sulfite exporter TauE/SafE family protein, partial [Gemmobacter sp.]
MDTQTLILMALLMGLGAMLYTSVGHAGASAYLAIMALFSVEPAVMRPTALVLNVLVASFTTWRYARAGQFDWRLAWPFMAGAVPLAFAGGMVQLPAASYRPLVGIVLLLAAARLLWPRPLAQQKAITQPPLPDALASGAAVGALSGLTGTGGGIFLSPILLFFGWAEPRRASGVAAGFILVNSLAGLAGNLSGVGRLPPELPWLILAVAIGAAVGSTLGLSRLSGPRLLQVLGVVLVIA